MCSLRRVVKNCSRRWRCEHVLSSCTLFTLSTSSFPLCPGTTPSGAPCNLLLFPLHTLVVLWFFSMSLFASLSTGVAQIPCPLVMTLSSKYPLTHSNHSLPFPPPRPPLLLSHPALRLARRRCLPGTQLTELYNQRRLVPLGATATVPPPPFPRHHHCPLCRHPCCCRVVMKASFPDVDGYCVVGRSPSTTQQS